MVRSIGLDPSRVLNNEALAEPHRIHATPPQQEEEEMRLLTRAFVDYVIEQVKQGPNIPGPRNSALPWWGRWDLNPRPLAPIFSESPAPQVHRPSIGLWYPLGGVMNPWTKLDDGPTKRRRAQSQLIKVCQVSVTGNENR